MVTHVYVAPHEDDGQVAEWLIDRAGDPILVQVTRDHGLGFIVPDEVADEFVAKRGELWPNEDELVDDDGDPATPPKRRGRPPKSAASAPAEAPATQE